VGTAAEQLRKVRAVKHEATSVNEFLLVVNCRRQFRFRLSVSA
jgi:hypothetical protein